MRIIVMKASTPTATRYAIIQVLDIVVMHPVDSTTYLDKIYNVGWYDPMLR